MAQETASAQTGSAKAEWSAHWPLVMAAMSGVMLSSISAGSIGVMMHPIEQEFGWSRTQITIGTSLVSLIGMTLATVMGLGIDKIGPRIVGLFTATLLCVAIACMSLVQGQIWQWWALWCVVGIAVSAMPTVWMKPIPSLFNKGRGLAIAVTLCGSGIATSLVPILANYLLEHYGWRATYVGLAGIFALFALPLIVLFFRGANEKAPKDATASAAPAAPLLGLSAKQGFRSFSFYKLALAAFLSMSAGVALILNLVPVLSSTGVTHGAAAGVASFLGVSTIVGRLIGGTLMDRFSAATIAAVSTCGGALLPIVLLLMPGEILWAIVATCMYGLFGGAKVPALAYLASKHFGAKAFGVLYGTINAAIALGVGLGPLVANIVYDMTKSYELVMWCALPILATAAILYSTMGKYPDFTKQAQSA